MTKKIIFGTLFLKSNAYFLENYKKKCTLNVELFLTSSGILIRGRAGIIHITKANRRILAEKYRME